MIESIVVVPVTLTYECIVSLNSYGSDVPWIVRFHKFIYFCHLHKFIFLDFFVLVTMVIGRKYFFVPFDIYIYLMFKIF